MYITQYMNETIIWLLLSRINLYSVVYVLKKQQMKYDNKHQRSKQTKHLYTKITTTFGLNSCQKTSRIFYRNPLVVTYSRPHVIFFFLH